LPIEKFVSDSISRFSADTTPTESDCCSPNGLPIAATGSPTRTPLVEPSGTGTIFAPGPRSCDGSTFTSATSAFGSVPTMRAGNLLPSANWAYTFVALLPAPVVTTCAFVAMYPSPSTANPEPSASLCCPSPLPAPPPRETSVTTPGASFW
jgi:hypothetical protein